MYMNINIIEKSKSFFNLFFRISDEFEIFITYLSNISIEKAHFLIISFVFEFAMNSQIFFDCNSVYFCSEIAYYKNKN